MLTWGWRMKPPFLRARRNFLFRRGDIEAADIDSANQWIGNVAVLGHTSFSGQIRILKNLNAQDIARAKRIVRLFWAATLVAKSAKNRVRLSESELEP